MSTPKIDKSIVSTNRMETMSKNVNFIKYTTKAANKIVNKDNIKINGENTKIPITLTTSRTTKTTTKTVNDIFLLEPDSIDYSDLLSQMVSNGINNSDNYNDKNDSYNNINNKIIQYNLSRATSLNFKFQFTIILGYTLFFKFIFNLMFVL